MSLRPKTQNDDHITQWLASHQHIAKALDRKQKKWPETESDGDASQALDTTSVGPNVASVAPYSTSVVAALPKLHTGQQQPVLIVQKNTKVIAGMTKLEIEQIVNNAMNETLEKMRPGSTTGTTNEQSAGPDSQDSGPVAQARREYAANLASMKQRGITEQEYIHSATTDGDGGPRMETSDY